MERFYITTPIYYINADPHLGHAYTTIVADAVARSHRLLGHEVFFLTGTDEHGQKVERSAQRAGLDPQVFADQVAERYRDLFARLDISNDDFIRTTEVRHKRAVEAIWRRVRDAGDLYKGPYEGWYCTVDEVFVPDTQLAADRRCPLCGGPVERLSEQSYYFRLSRYQQPLLDHYRSAPSFIEPEIRRNEMIAFVSAGLDDLSVSRTSFRWGIPVPDDPSHIVYVWVDALTNYLAAIGFGSDDATDQARFAKFWPVDVHLMGKEIVRQHTVYWPAFLMSAGLPLPRQIFGHGFWLMAGAKMSKSVGNIIRPHEYLDLFGVDAFRYFVLREMVFGHDASFTDEAFLGRYNADLANDLGNLASRVTTMIERYCEGVVPVSPVADRTEAEARLHSFAEAAITGVVGATAGFRFDHALRHTSDLISSTNRYLVEAEPWMLAKDPGRRGRLNAVLYAAADALRVVAALIDPVMPGSASRLRGMLGVGQEGWVDLRPGTLREGARLGRVEPLFPRVEKTVDELRAMTAEGRPPGAAMGSPGDTAAAQATDGRLTIDEFMKIDLRTARVVEAERVPNSRKLTKLVVDLGAERRTLVAGIAESYTPESLVGRTVVVVTNLKPVRLMGIESNGMVLAASPEGGKPLLVSFDEATPPGIRVR